ncbi:NigD1/NigD2 family lipoprotein [Dysgonomonas massiliensis]|uniref:NigD-like protein n=1 Tax=Dysgonomonas massiliensis TaxID=2040292 RepID=UPI000C78EA16|nr:NigD-like protein [Dysgonomonas massiliensis]
MNSIFNLKKIVLFGAVIVTALGFHSCLDDDNDSYSKLFPNALVTTKTATDNTFFLQLDDSTTLLPINMDKSPYGDKEVRALVNYDVVKDPSGPYSKSVHVNWIDSILTKTIAPDLGEENDKVYGTDPVEMVADWITIAEDGYLTLRFRTLWDRYSEPHFVNLLLGNNPDNPYEVEFRHNAHGDVDGRWGDGLVAFRLDQLPDTEGETVKLTLKWKSFSGDKSAEFDYCTRKSTAGGEEAAKVRNQLNIQ